MTYNKAIVKIPASTFPGGITGANLGTPDMDIVLNQHHEYIRILENCGLELFILDPDPDHPDSTFVEDTAVLTKYFAVITNPGALSRRSEVHNIEAEINKHYKDVEHISPPGTLDGGDVLMVRTHFIIGISERTNIHGADQLIRILNKYGLTGEHITISNLLHLKSGVNYLENNTLLMSDIFKEHSAFKDYQKIIVPASESYAANSLWVNGKVIVPKGFHKTKKSIKEHGYETLETGMSEFRKLDGGLSCLSLRF